MFVVVVYKKMRRCIKGILGRWCKKDIFGRWCNIFGKWIYDVINSIYIVSLSILYIFIILIIV